MNVPQKDKPVGRGKASRNFTIDEVMDLLDLIEELTPLGAMEWGNLARKYNKRDQFSLCLK